MYEGIWRASWRAGVAWLVGLPVASAMLVDLLALGVVAATLETFVLRL